MKSSDYSRSCNLYTQSPLVPFFHTIFCSCRAGDSSSEKKDKQLRPSLLSEKDGTGISRGVMLSMDA